MSGSEVTTSGPGVRTHPDHRDPSLRGRRYSIPYEAVWEGIVATLHEVPRCEVSESDDESGFVRAEVTRRFPKAVDDVEIRIGLDSDAQTWVSMSSAAREGRFDLGANERRVRQFFDALDRAIGARPGSILSPRMPGPPDSATPDPGPVDTGTVEAETVEAGVPDKRSPTSADVPSVGEPPVGADRG